MNYDVIPQARLRLGPYILVDSGETDYDHAQLFAVHGGGRITLDKAGLLAHRNEWGKPERFVYQVKRRVDHPERKMEGTP